MRHADAQDAERAELHQDAGVQHRDAGRRGHVAVRRPRVQRPHAGQHAEADHEEREAPLLEVVVVLSPRASTVMSNVPAPASMKTAKMPMKISTEPATSISVSFIAPYSFVRVKVPKLVLAPQTTISRYIGSTATSYQKKKKKRSCGDEDAVDAGDQQEQQDEEVLRAGT